MHRITKRKLVQSQIKSTLDKKHYCRQKRTVYEDTRVDPPEIYKSSQFDYLDSVCINIDRSNRKYLRNLSS